MGIYLSLKTNFQDKKNNMKNLIFGRFFKRLVVIIIMFFLFLAYNSIFEIHQKNNFQYTIKEFLPIGIIFLIGSYLLYFLAKLLKK